MSYTWAEDCTTALLAHVASGITQARAAELLNERFGTNHSKSSVEKKLARLKQPKVARRDSAVFWPDGPKAKLRELYAVVPGMAFTDITAGINKECGTSYSRAAVIGQAKRLGLSGKVAAPPLHRTKRIRVVAANGNSARKRLISTAPDVKLPALKCVEIIPRNLSLMDLEDGDCRYIAGDDHLYCAHPIKPGSSYCPAHHALVWVKPQPPARTAHKYHGTDFAKRVA